MLVAISISTLHSSIPVSQVRPVNPLGHRHWNPPSLFRHSPPFWHGLFSWRHSSRSWSHEGPCQPESQWQNGALSSRDPTARQPPWIQGRTSAHQGPSTDWGAKGKKKKKTREITNLMLKGQLPSRGHSNRQGLGGALGAKNTGQNSFFSFSLWTERGPLLCRCPALHLWGLSCEWMFTRGISVDLCPYSLDLVLALTYLPFPSVMATTGSELSPLPISLAARTTNSYSVSGLRSWMT